MGQNSATTRRIRHQLLPQLEKNLDVAVLLAGVNDVLARRTPQDWNDDLTAIAGELGARARTTVVAGIPPFDAFPALPKTLGRYLAGRAAAFDEVSRRVCADHASSVWLDARTLLPAGVEFFSRDRFHPSAFGYRRWAGAVADLVES